MSSSIISNLSFLIPYLSSIKWNIKLASLLKNKNVRFLKSWSIRYISAVCKWYFEHGRERERTRRRWFPSGTVRDHRGCVAGVYRERWQIACPPCTQWLVLATRVDTHLCVSAEFVVNIQTIIKAGTVNTIFCNINIFSKLLNKTWIPFWRHWILFQQNSYQVDETKSIVNVYLFNNTLIK